MLKGFWLVVIVFVVFFEIKNEIPVVDQTTQSKVVNSFISVAAFKKRKSTKKKSREEIKKLCAKAKLKILSLDEQGRRNSTASTRRCKKAYSNLRYQACHMKKYKEKVVLAAKKCKK